MWAGDAQLPPHGAWRTWIFLGGRGAGKTRAGAEWIAHLVHSKAARRIALIAPTLHDARSVLVEGVSGLLAAPPALRPMYRSSLRRLEWRNGAVAQIFSAQDPESLRGPQFDAAWGDELCFWAYPQQVLDTLEHGLRLGARPRLLLTTTPRPLPALKELLMQSDAALTRARTFDNERNLSPVYVAALRERFEGTARDRQELLGEIVDEAEGAYWTREDLEQARIATHPPLARIVVGVDPPVTAGPDADTCGIIVAGAYGAGEERVAVILGDRSVRGLTPRDWAVRVRDAVEEFAAHAVSAEANQGGEMVETILRIAGVAVPIKLERARLRKSERAAPFAGLYRKGRVKHLGAHLELEDEMCTFNTRGFRGSPDRLDALVWALTDLLRHSAEPGIRKL